MHTLNRQLPVLFCKFRVWPLRKISLVDFDIFISSISIIIIIVNVIFINNNIIII